MLIWIRKIDDWLESVERGLAVILFSLLIALICGNVVARDMLHMASHNLMELAPRMVLWLALVGATLALKHRRHIKIELLLRFLSPAWQRRATALTSLFALLAMAVLGYSAFAFMLNETKLFGSWGWLAICFPLFFLLAAFRFSVLLLDQMCSAPRDGA